MNQETKEMKSVKNKRNRYLISIQNYKYKRIIVNKIPKI